MIFVGGQRALMPMSRTFLSNTKHWHILSKNIPKGKGKLCGTGLRPTLLTCTFSVSKPDTVLAFCHSRKEIFLRTRTCSKHSDSSIIVLKKMPHVFNIFLSSTKSNNQPFHSSYYKP